MVKKKIGTHRSFWKRLRTKYKLTFSSENSLEEVWSFHLSQLGAILFFTGLSIVIAAGTIFLFTATPLNRLLPGYLRSEDRVKLVDNAFRVDSLLRKMKQHESILNNISGVIEGNVVLDSVWSVPDSMIVFPTDSLLARSERSTEFVRKYEADERFTVNLFKSNSPADNFIFNTPLNGVVKNNFSPTNKVYGIEITAAPNSSVSAILDGTVVSISYTIDQRYIMQIQHSNNFFSIYKNNASPLKQIGDKILAGEKIAIYNDVKSPSPLPFLFELWHSGNPVNPAEYIAF